MGDIFEEMGTRSGDNKGIDFGGYKFKQRYEELKILVF